MVAVLLKDVNEILLVDIHLNLADKNVIMQGRTLKKILRCLPIRDRIFNIATEIKPNDRNILIFKTSRSPETAISDSTISSTCS